MAGLDDEIIALHEKIGELERKLAGTIRHGRITDVDPAKQLLRIRLNPDSETDEMKSAWVPYMQQAGEFKFHNPPSVGQNATLFAPAGDPAQAVGIPFTWSNQFPSPGDKDDEHIITFGDLKVSYKKDRYIVSVGKASIQIDKDKNIKMVADELIEQETGGSKRILTPGYTNDIAPRVKHNE